ncbi:hypothetical protein ACFQ7O_15240 [Streptomyces sp. NPDC056485]|uniref:hypothetical protein n=1 Tax=Streptomyces sp. NPDC056485 TaxID=3345834 RepID=UPI00367F2F9C
MRAELLDRIELPGPAGQCHSVPGGGWLLVMRGSPPRTTLLDAGLHLVGGAGRAIPAGSGCAWYGDALAVAGPDTLMLHRGGARLWWREQGSWDETPKGEGSCAFAAGGTELWAVVRTGRTDEEAFEGDGEGDGDGDGDGDNAGPDTEGADPDASEVECQVRDASTGALLARRTLGSEVTHSRILAHPDGRHMAVITDDGHSVDGHWMLRAGNRLHARTLAPDPDREPCALALSPSGGQYTLLDPTGLVTLAFPTGEPIAEREDPGRGGTSAFDRSLGYCAEHLLLDTYIGDDAPPHTAVYRTPALRGPLEQVGEIRYDAAAPPRAVAVAVAGNGTWITADDTGVSLWALRD